MCFARHVNPIAACRGVGVCYEKHLQNRWIQETGLEDQDLLQLRKDAKLEPSDARVVGLQMGFQPGQMTWSGGAMLTFLALV